jgi:hypothetical protein
VAKELPKPVQIDRDNLKADESVGTFRWNNDLTLINAPSWNPKMRSILLGLSKGWNAYFEPRFEETSVNNEIKVEPH